MRSYSRRAPAAVMKVVGLALRELNRAPGKQVQHQCSARRHRRVVCAPGFINEPASTSLIEARLGIQGHDEVDFTVRVPVMRTHYRLHVDDIDAETMRLWTWLDDTAEANAARLAIAHPACGDGVLAQLEEPLDLLAVSGKPSVEIRLQLRIECPAIDSTRYRCNELGEPRQPFRLR